MGLSAKLFFDNDENETLFRCISLTPEQLEDAKTKKDKLLKLIKPELASSLDAPVKHWLQGSYKNHTLIRPIQKGDEFDIDVGLYVLCNAEDEGLSALEVKQLNRNILEWYVLNRPEAKVELFMVNVAGAEASMTEEPREGKLHAGICVWGAG
ncbi:cyclic GMP-AMP synthase DncV-like nucleotidyltransferase [Sedimenticola sp.]|uniref:cyclic GMP-AMP synthase DncV-like nucleotidyltransferase n=1 Tax=Sedimenticola sp. TaxID=1940285 RepID=UPI003D0FD4D2